MVADAKATATRDADAVKIVESIRSNKWRKPVEKIRAEFRRVLTETGDLKVAKRAVDTLKKKLPGVLWSGTFSSREKPVPEKLLAHAGLLCGDLDNLDTRLDGVRSKLATSPHLFALFTSPTGNGLKAVFCVFCVPVNAERHAESFRAIANHVRQLTGEEIDAACKDIGRLCFVSFDPDALLNTAATVLPPLPPLANENHSASLVTSGLVEIGTRQSIAEKILGAIRWTNDVHGFCQCPGQNLHTTGNGERDCEIHLDGAPTLFCFHNSCTAIRDGVNHELRSRIGKAEWKSATHANGDYGSESKHEPDTATDVRGLIVRTLLSKTPAFQQRQQIADAVNAALCKAGRLFHHAELRDFPSAMFFHAERKRLERIRSDAFLSWLSDWLAVNRAESLFRHVQAAIETAALSSPHTSAIVPESYWCSRPGSVYLSNGDGQIVKITGCGLQLTDNGTDGVLFAAGKTLAPWNVGATPADPFETCALFREARTAAAHGKDLLRVWIYSLPTNPRTKPPLCLSGEVGSGKTRIGKGIAELYGLPFRAAKVEEANEADFWPSVDAGGLYVLDNADSRCRWLADALANAATDGCVARRRLYTNSDLVTLRANAWLAVTTANPTFASDAGLADRLLLIRTQRTDGGTSDSALSDEIAAHRDSALVHIAECIAAALHDSKPTPPGLNKRHPDFAAFAVRLGRAVTRERETIAALQSAEADKSAFCLENDYIGAALLAYLSGAKAFSGTAAELATRLIEVDRELEGNLSAKRLGKRLTALWPHLHAALATARKESDRKGFTVFTFKAAECAEFQTLIS